MGTNASRPPGAASHLGDDYAVAVFLDHSSPVIADQLIAAGVAQHRLRHIAPAERRALSRVAR